MSFNFKTEEYYKRFIELQEKLRKSEEERLKLEMKFNEMVRITKEEEQVHYRKLRAQYKRFLEEDRRRQDRNERILRTLERIDSRVAMLIAKTERFKLLRQQYQTFLDRVYRTNQNKKSEVTNVPSKVNTTEKPKPVDDPSDIVQTYLQNLSSNKLKEMLKKEEEARSRLPITKTTDLSDKYCYSDLYSDSESKPNYANSIADDIMHSIYSRGGQIGNTGFSQSREFSDNPKSERDTPKQKNYDNTAGVRNSVHFKSPFSSNGEQANPDITGADNSETDDLSESDEILYKNPVEFNKAKWRESEKTLDQQFVNSGKLTTPQAERTLERVKNDQFLGDNLLPRHTPHGNKLDDTELQTAKNQNNMRKKMFESDQILVPTEEEYNTNIIEPQQTIEETKETDGNVKEVENEICVEPEQVFDAERFVEESPQNRQTIKAASVIVEEQKNNVEPPEPETEQELFTPANTENEQNREQPVEQQDGLVEDNIKDETSHPSYVDSDPQPHDESGQPVEQFHESSLPIQQEDESGNSGQQYHENAHPDDRSLSVEQFDEITQPTQQHIENVQLIQQYNESLQPVQQYVEGGEAVPQYNENSHPVEQYDESSHPVEQYDESDQPIQQYDNIQSLEQYDESGQAIQQYDESGQAIQQYDESGQPIQAQHYDEQGHYVPQYDETGQSLQQYDEHGQPVQSYDQQYDEHGQFIQQYDEHGQVIPSQYDEHGQLIQQYDDQGQLIPQYDENGQLLQYPEYSGNQEPMQQYDQTGQLIQDQPQYDENGQLIQQPYDQQLYSQPYEENAGTVDEQDANVVEPVAAGSEPNENTISPAHEEAKKACNVMEMLDTDTESTKQETKISHDSDFDISNG